MDTVLRSVAETIADLYLDWRGRGAAPDAELDAFADLLRAIAWDVPQRHPAPATIAPGLRHLSVAIANITGSASETAIAALRASIGFVPWGTLYARSPWSESFLDEFACGELIGPTGYVFNSQVSLGLLLIGPETTYREHAHASTEIYCVLSGGGEWAIARPDAARRFEPGEIVLVQPHQRHSIRTAREPLLVAYTWKESPAADIYYNERGDWGNGDRVLAELVSG